MRIHIGLVCAVVLSVFGSLPGGTLATSSSTLEVKIVQRAALRLGHQSSLRVFHWLRRQPSVRRVARGWDGKTVEIQFRDGQKMFVLSPVSSTVGVPVRSMVHTVRSPGRALQAANPKALVLTPFASELGVAGSGDVEVDDLQRAGFAVDQATNEAVTVASMARMSSYNVVYMHTHSGTTSNGDGIVATGQLATGDPNVAPLISDGSVTVVGVAGSSNMYYAITSRYFSTHMTPFPHDSLVFLNGCKLLPATVLVQTLLARGVGVFVSWDEDAQAQDDFLSAAGFFNFMGQGMSADAAISALRAAGYGTSQYAGRTATLGYRGDGTITLSRAAGGQGGGATPTATRTAVPSPTSSGVAPTPTATVPGATAPPTATPTRTAAPTVTTTRAVAPPLRIVRMQAAIAPGGRQQLTAQSAAGVPVSFTVTMPSGLRLTAARTADASGMAAFAYVQPKNSITRQSRRALVSVQAGSGVATVSLTDGYTIRFAPIDLAVEPRQEAPGASVTIWVHARARARVDGRVVAGKKVARFTGRTGKQAWVKFTYRIPVGARPGQSISVTASSVWHGKTYKTKATLGVR